jgi:hypothetical protein
VDGDVIFRFLDEAGRKGLEGLVFEGTDEEVKRLFRELAIPVVGCCAAAVGGRGGPCRKGQTTEEAAREYEKSRAKAEDLGHGELLDAVESWLTNVLMPLL